MTRTRAANTVYEPIFGFPVVMPCRFRSSKVSETSSTPTVHRAHCRSSLQKPRVGASRTSTYERREKRERSTAASHLCRETRPASSFRVTRTSQSRRTWSSRRPSSRLAPFPRASARARATAPPRFARHRAPRASSPAAEPVRIPRISEVPPRRRRVDVERDAPFIRRPRAGESAPRPVVGTARGRSTRHSADKAIVVGFFSLRERPRGVRSERHRL